MAAPALARIGTSQTTAAECGNDEQGRDGHGQH